MPTQYITHINLRDFICFKKPSIQNRIRRSILFMCWLITWNCWKNIILIFCTDLTKKKYTLSKKKKKYTEFVRAQGYSVQNPQAVYRLYRVFFSNGEKCVEIPNINTLQTLKVLFGNRIWNFQFDVLINSKILAFEFRI